MKQIATRLTDTRPMQRVIGRKEPAPIPEEIFERSPNMSRDREALMYACEVHGVVEPIEIAIGQTGEIGYLRGECLCRYLARERRNYQHARETEQVVSQKRTASKTYTWLGIDQARLELMTFETFRPEMQPEQFQRGMIEAKGYAEGYASMCLASPVGQPNLLFQSQAYGLGKTHLASAIVNRLREHGVPCLFATAQDLFNSLYAAPFEEKPLILKQASDTPLLVLDDLDKLHVPSETDGVFQKRTLFDILDRRYKGCRPTIITTNVQDLTPWLNDATISRLYEAMQPVIMAGMDYRLIKRRQR